MAKLTNEIIKMFAVTSCVGATIKSAEASELRLVALNNQCNNAMRVFNAKAGRAVYFGTANIVEEIWIKLQKKHETTIHHEKLSVFIEMLCMLVPPTHFKSFIGISPYRSRVEVTEEEYAEMAKLALELDCEFNKVFGTSPYALNKPKQKIEKVKKARDKSEKKKVQKIKNKKLSLNSKNKLIEKKIKNDKAFALEFYRGKLSNVSSFAKKAIEGKIKKLEEELNAQATK